MKTIEAQSAAPTEAAPANLTTRQLARSLIKSAPATAQSPAGMTSEKTGATPTDRIQSAPEGAPTTEPAAVPETEVLPDGHQPEPPAEETTAELPPENQEESPADAPEEAPAETPTEEPAKAELPAELRDAMEIAKGDGKKGVAELLKRVHKLADERDTNRNARLATEEQNAQLRRELQEARVTKPQTQTGTNGSLHPAVAAIAQEVSNVDQWITWVEDHPEGGELPDGKGGKVALDGQMASRLKRDLENQRAELVARKVQTEGDVKRQFASDYATHHAAALESYPWMKSATAPEHQEMQAILSAFPAFKQSPDYELAIGDFLAGKALREARAKAKASGNGAGLRKAAPAREPTRVVTTPPGGGARKADGDEEVTMAEAQFQKSGSTRDLAKLNAAKARANRTATK